MQFRFCFRGWEVSLDLYPSTAEDSVSQFVRLTLTLSLDQQVRLSPAQLAETFVNSETETHRRPLVDGLLTVMCCEG